MHRALASCLLFGAVFSAPGASAQKKGGILVLKLEAKGFPAELTAALDEAVRSGVQRTKKGKLLPAPALDFSGMQMAAGCLDDGAECLLAIGRPLNATQVIRVVASGTPQLATFTFTSIVVRRGARLQVHEAKLEDVGSDSKEEVAWHAMAALGVKPPPLSGGIELAMAEGGVGGLEGAEYFLDDKKVPRSALDNVAAGQHRLEVHQKGFETFIWIGEVKKGRKEQVKVELKPKGALAYDPPPPPPLDDTPPVSSTPLEMDPPPPAVAPPPPAADVRVDTSSQREAPIVYTFVLGGAAVVAAGVAVGFGVYGLNVRKEANTALAPFTGDPTYQACTENRSLPECDPYQPHLDRLHTATVGTIASWVTAGVLAAGAVTAFFIEWNAGGSDEGVAFGLAPTDGGAAASMSMRY